MLIKLYSRLDSLTFQIVLFKKTDRIIRKQYITTVQLLFMQLLFRNSYPNIRFFLWPLRSNSISVEWETVAIKFFIWMEGIMPFSIVENPFEKADVYLVQILHRTY